MISSNFFTVYQREKLYKKMCEQAFQLAVSELLSRKKIFFFLLSDYEERGRGVKAGPLRKNYFFKAPKQSEKNVTT